ncbi:MAG: ATP-binding protein [Candidatus Helarchaeota archaeon]
MRCKGLKDKCGKEASVYLRFIKRAFCKEHFIEFELKRLRRTIRRFNMIKATQDKIIVALSGGKDSSALLDMLISYYNLVEKAEYRPEIEALHINLGITENNYSQKCLDSIIKLTNSLNVKLHVINLKDKYGFGINDLKSNPNFKNRKICALCGTIKRYLLNKIGIELGGTKVATGHLLDDEVSNLLKNLIFGSKDLLLKMSAYLKSDENTNLLSRIKPLYEISEFETSNYVKLKNIPFISEKCPNASENSFKMKRVSDVLEDKFPNSRYLLMRNFIKYYQPALMLDAKFRSSATSKCKKCGQPTSIDICSFCRIVESFHSKN